jgi:hypothetical protein
MPSNFIDDEKSDYNESNITIEFDWEEDKPETLKALCPRLFEAKWSQKNPPSDPIASITITV